MKENFFDFSDIDPLFIKKHHIANTFLTKMSEIGLSREELSIRLGKDLKETSKLLSGEVNMNVKEMLSLSLAMGYDFEIKFKG